MVNTVTYQVCIKGRVVDMKVAQAYQSYVPLALVKGSKPPRVRCATLSSSDASSGILSVGETGWAFCH